MKYKLENHITIIDNKKTTFYSIKNVGLIKRQSINIIEEWIKILERSLRNI